MKEKGVKIDYLVGTMIEVPRGAMTADEIAAEAQFFSFGTNDLTQTTFGFSRDDIGKFLGAYQDKKILDKDPFSTIDTVGVGSLVRTAVEKGRVDAPGHQARHLRRAWRRSLVDSFLREGRIELRQHVAVSRAGRAAGGCAGGVVGEGWRLTVNGIRDRGIRLRGNTFALAFSPKPCPFYGHHQPPPQRSRQSNRRRRGRRTSCVCRQRAHRKRDRRGRAPDPGSRRTGRQAAGARRRRWRGDGARRRAALARAACDQQDSASGRSRRHQHARLQGRGAAEHRVGLALRPEDTAARRDRRHRDSRQRRRRRLGAGGRHVPRARRSKSAICSTTCPPAGNS